MRLSKCHFRKKGAATSLQVAEHFDLAKRNSHRASSLSHMRDVLQTRPPSLKRATGTRMRASVAGTVIAAASWISTTRWTHVCGELHVNLHTLTPECTCVCEAQRDGAPRSQRCATYDARKRVNPLLSRAFSRRSKRESCGHVTLIAEQSRRSRPTTYHRRRLSRAKVTVLSFANSPPSLLPAVANLQPGIGVAHPWPRRTVRERPSPSNGEPRAR